MRISILIPAFNEENTIKELIEKVIAVNLDDVEKEIIVINDGSTDNTIANIVNYKNINILKNEFGKGKGGAVKTGIKHSTGNIIIIQDADLEYDPEDYPRLIQPILSGETDIVYGSRYINKDKKKKIHLYLIKHIFHIPSYLGGRIITILLNLFYRLSLTDSPTCYKVFLAGVIKCVDVKNNGFSWEPEVTAKLAKMGFTFHEVPISYYPRTSKEGKKINWKDGFHAIWTLLKYRIVD